MKNGIEQAIEQMGQKDEAGLNYIYSKTYNFVYLRAKSIIQNEEDVKQLMQKVYLQAYESVDGLRGENLYEWLGKRTYLLGCQYYKKRKEREASFLEMDEDELSSHKIKNTDKSIEIICDVLEGLPDMYQATLFAFYYDYLKVEEIAELMDCSPDIIKNRLNYVRKYIKRAMEDYVEEHGGESAVKIVFSVEILCNALRKWSVDHCLGITTAQSVYAAICRAAGLQAGSVYVEGKEFAGVNNTVVYHKQDDLKPLEEEILNHGKKLGIDKRLLPGIVAIGAGILVIIIAAVMILGKPDTKAPAKKNPPVTTEKDKPKEEPKDEQTNDGSDVTDPQEPAADNPDQNTEDDVQTAESEYIFEKSNTEALTREEVQAHTKEELRFGRNEIFARHGVIFGVEDLDAYFRSKSWYEPKMSLDEFFDQVEMTMIEEGNINLIREVEATK